MPVRHVSQGDVLFMGRWKLEVIAPFKDVGTRTSVRTRSASLKSNDRSLVLRASAGGRRVLLTGDLEEAGERRLLASGEDLRAEVLKVAHHGSRSSTSRRWLAAVQPRLALISAGEGNAYGHPASGVLQLLEEAGATTLRTDLQGRLHLIFPVSSAASEASNSSAAPEASKLRQRHPRISTPGTH